MKGFDTRPRARRSEMNQGHGNVGSACLPSDSNLGIGGGGGGVYRTRLTVPPIHQSRRGTPVRIGGEVVECDL